MTESVTPGDDVGPPGRGRPGRRGLPVGDLPTSGPPTVDLPVPSSVLAIGAHPDDIEFGCGGTLAKWAAAGCRLHHLVLTDGSKGSWDPGADLAALVSTRQRESEVAADVIDGRRGAPDPNRHRVLFLGRVDGELVNGVGERRDIARIIRTLRPSVVIGHDPWRRYRLHPDHRAAGFCTLDAVVAARDPHFFGELGLPPHRPEALLLFEADQPNHVEDVHGFDGVKIDALLCHSSQGETTMGIVPDLAPRAGHDGLEDASSTGEGQRAEFALDVRRQLGDHGALAGLAAGEAFHLITEV
jgi:LmbE family N-acetylglucosaminyl deacetylase